MTKKWDSIILKIAAENHTTPAQVRKDMLSAMQAGQKSTDPMVRARWDAIPKKGTELTLVEFLDYLMQATSGK